MCVSWDSFETASPQPPKGALGEGTGGTVVAGDPAAAGQAGHLPEHGSYAKREYMEGGCPQPTM